MPGNQGHEEAMKGLYVRALKSPHMALVQGIRLHLCGFPSQSNAVKMRLTDPRAQLESGCLACPKLANGGLRDMSAARPLCQCPGSLLYHIDVHVPRVKSKQQLVRGVLRTVDHYSLLRQWIHMLPTYVPIMMNLCAFNEIRHLGSIP